jgi:acetyl esterase/lipase
VEDLGIPPENIILAGDSAGGGLSLALLMYLRDNSYPLPSGGILMSPWVGKQHVYPSSRVIVANWNLQISQ